MVKTDVFQRGVPWMLLLKRQQVHRDRPERPARARRSASPRPGWRCLALLAAPWVPWLAGRVAALAALTVVALNRSFYAFLARKRGAAFAAASVPLHLVYYACCGVSVVLALVLWQFWASAAAADGRAGVDGPVRRAGRPGVATPEGDAMDRNGEGGRRPRRQPQGRRGRGRWR